LNVDDDLSARQALSQLVVLLHELAHRFSEGILLGLGAAPMRRQTQVALLAPVSEVGRVEALAAKQGADSTRLVG
jgi:hypothetical protein